MRSIGMPEIVAILGFFLIIPVAVFVFAYLTRRLRTQERLRAIEKGVTIVQLAEQDATRCRRVGIVYVAMGLGRSYLPVGLPELQQGLLWRRPQYPSCSASACCSNIA